MTRERDNHGQCLDGNTYWGRDCICGNAGAVVAAGTDGGLARASQRWSKNSELVTSLLPYCVWKRQRFALLPFRKNRRTPSYFSFAEHFFVRTGGADHVNPIRPNE